MIHDDAVIRQAKRLRREAMELNVMEKKIRGTPHWDVLMGDWITESNFVTIARTDLRYALKEARAEHEMNHEGVNVQVQHDVEKAVNVQENDKEGENGEQVDRDWFKDLDELEGENDNEEQEENGNEEENDEQEDVVTDSKDVWATDFDFQKNEE